MKVYKHRQRAEETAKLIPEHTEIVPFAEGWIIVVYDWNEDGVDEAALEMHDL